MSGGPILRPSAIFILRPMRRGSEVRFFKDRRMVLNRKDSHNLTSRPVGTYVLKPFTENRFCVFQFRIGSLCCIFGSLGFEISLAYLVSCSCVHNEVEWEFRG